MEQTKITKQTESRKERLSVRAVESESQIRF